jgi:rare lipoprotein A (peptidoglycan hydrolase)
MKPLLLALSLVAASATAQARDLDRSSKFAQANSAPTSGAAGPVATVEPTVEPTLIIAAPTPLPRLRAAPRVAAPGGCAGQRVISAYYFHGTRTASGARFDPNGLTAAHRTFAFGTRLTVVNPRNGKSVTVTVNDRGPFVRGVSLDLSRGAAMAIGMRGTGAVCMARL